ncbi:MAG: hypothetical protein ABI162_20225 [Luteolibacter sp.]
MTAPPQSSPDAPARPVQSFEFDSLLWWKKSGVWIVGLFFVIGCFFSFAQPRYICSGRKAPQTEAVNNARQIGLALSEFQDEFGQMPDAGTIEKVRQKSGTDLKLGTRSSNDFFRQLLASGIARSENIFYAKISGTRKSDNGFAGVKALEKGECGFTYLMGATKDCNPNRPIAMTPMIPGTDRFDLKPFDGKAVILKADNSVSSYPIVIKTGHVMVNGRDLFDPANPIWGGKPATIAWPE